MKNRPITFHIEGNSVINDVDFWETFARVKPDGALVMNHLGAAYKAKELVVPLSPVIFRTYDPFGDSHISSFDNAFHQIHRDPIAVLDHMQATLGAAVHDFHHIYGWNEPSHNDGDPNKNLEQMLNWFIVLADEARARNIKLSIGEIATDKTIKAFDVQDVQSERWDNYIRMMDRHRDWHIFGFHSYISFVTPADVLISRGSDPLNATLFHPDAWVWDKLATDYVYFEGNKVMPSHYHIGRELLIVEIRAKELGLAPIPYSLTESGMDEKNDMPRWGEAKSRFPTPPYDAMRGHLGHRTYWAWLMGKTAAQFTDDDYCRMLFNNYKWIIETHPNSMNRMTLFAVNEGWHLPEGFQYWRPQLALFWELVANYHDARDAASPPIEPPVEPPVEPPIEPPDTTPIFPPSGDPHWRVGEVKSVGAITNVRSTPAILDYNKFEQIQIRDWSAAYFNFGTEWAIDDGTYLWIPMIRNGIECYVSAAHFTTRNNKFV